MQKGVLHQMSLSVNVFVVFSLNFAMPPRRNHRFCFRPPRMVNDRVRVVTPIGQQILGVQPLDQGMSLRAISRGTFCNKDSERHAMRIHGQMYLGIEPPFVWFIA